MLKLVSPLLCALFVLSGESLCLAQETTPLTLPQAVAIALDRNPERAAVRAETRAAAADVKEARSAFLPQLGFSEIATRSNDPVYVFGTRLRQSRFTAADFALNRLNQPTPIGNFATRFSAQWNIFDSFSSSLNLRRTRQLNDAASQRLAMADQQVVFRVIQAYYNLLLAGRQLEVAEQAVKTAQAVADDSHARLQAGTVVESDYLTAQVNLAARQQELIRARNSAALALVQLNLMMGVDADRQYTLAEALAERTFKPVSIAEAEASALKNRPDLKQASAEEAAQKSGVQMAKSAFGPRFDIFAASELESPSLFSNSANNWLAGAELHLDLFSGGRKAAGLSREKALLDRASARRKLAEDNVRLEVRRAYYDWDSARQMVDVARAAVAQAEESLRITGNRYRSGLATITELLKTEDAARTTRAGYWDALYRYHVSYAALELATGSLSAHSPVVTQ